MPIKYINSFYEENSEKNLSIVLIEKSVRGSLIFWQSVAILLEIIVAEA